MTIPKHSNSLISFLYPRAVAKYSNILILNKNLAPLSVILLLNFASKSFVFFLLVYLMSWDILYLSVLIYLF